MSLTGFPPHRGPAECQPWLGLGCFSFLTPGLRCKTYTLLFLCLVYVHGIRAYCKSLTVCFLGLVQPRGNLVGRPLVCQSVQCFLTILQPDMGFLVFSNHRHHCQVYEAGEHAENDTNNKPIFVSFFQFESFMWSSSISAR